MSLLSSAFSLYQLFPLLPVSLYIQQRNVFYAHLLSLAFWNSKLVFQYKPSLLFINQTKPPNKAIKIKYLKAKLKVVNQFWRIVKTS